MKKTVLFTLLTVFTASITAKQKPSTFVYNKPLGFLLNSFEIGFDKRISDQGFIGAMIGYGAAEENDFNNGDMEELKFEFNFKTFLNKYTDKRTYYVQPFLMYKQRKEDGYDYFGPSRNSFKTAALDIGFVFAKRYNWDRMFMDIQLGGGIISPISGEKEDRYYISNPIVPYSKGVHPRIGINFGLSI